MSNNNSSGVNTVLLVLIIIAIVGFGTWYVMGRNVAAPEESDATIRIDVPDSVTNEAPNN